MSQLAEAPSLEMPLSVVLASGAATVILASALAYVLLMEKKSNHSTTAAAKSLDQENAVSLDRSKYPAGQISVYYATQTGTSESFARTIEREGAQHGFFVHVIDLDDKEVDQLLENSEEQQDGTKKTARVVVLAATYGEGEAPDNAAVFVRALCEKANTQLLFERNNTAAEHADIPEPTCLDGVEYCVFGLGNKQYDHYNAMGKFFDHALERLGGKRILPVGLGNDDDDLENDFETWKDNQFWPTLKKLYLPEGAVVPQSAATTKTLPDCQYAIQYHKTGTQPTKFTMDQVHGSSRHYFSSVHCPVTVVRELRSKDDPGSTVHVEVDISKVKNELKYQTADNLGVIPVNDPDIVHSVAQSLGYDLDQTFSLHAAPSHEWHGAPFPMPITVRECLSKYCDLTGAPRRSELKLLAAYAHDPTDQKALQRMASVAGRVEYREKIIKSYVGLAQLLQLCPSIAMPLEHFLNLCPLQQTRYYTISSSSSVYPDTIHLTVAVTRVPRPDDGNGVFLFKGVCSNYLAGLDNNLICVHNRLSTFRLPADPAIPILMIGPGTGIAPMRALLQERAYQRQQQQQKATAAAAAGKNILYFGCKRESQDFIYRDELEAWVRTGVLDTLRCAFSRDTPDKVVYVQHLLAQDEEAVYELMEQQGAYVYVCGGVKMGQDVLETLNRIVASQGKVSHDQAKEYLNKMSSSGRLVQELWA